MNPAPQPAENPPALLCEPPAQTPAPVLRRVSAPLRFATRLTRLSAHALRGQRIVRQLFPQLDAAGKQQQIRDWSAELLRLSGIALQVNGAPQQTPSLVAANHVSWIDIFAINAVQPVRFVSKSEAAGWPLIGPLVRGVGTLFIERERAQDVVRVIHQMAQCLQDGDHVGVFPEGTTSYGHDLLPFHANLFQAACSSDCPAAVQPVLLFYADQRSGRFSRAASYVGDETMVGSLWRMSAAAPLRVEVNYLPPLRAPSRRALAQQTREAIAEHLHQRLRDSR
ncbi:MAG: lysophospholipid acyltransferase family protein [Thiomonas sp.]|uniref:lysophospholipid acyltransferase family protein n=1 Tax=Thiomonas TaxID=32012 RepID=UPI0023A48E55|nr:MULTISPECIES: lysophospholipid acyltransferase family protein [Thiomonas]MDE1978806.1 1-acyl-sn-glycerol-3-phosphate acyltransferase [Betaproteobacteria bacterium]MDE2268826.1 1-acyl-sn-glycerol-3-phosphate acyltransferase [Betaproteobacteria bacterium]HML81303.1 lysophospholipid acyltransferase family protein [Thiomonas arsenitoxydans]